MASLKSLVTVESASIVVCRLFAVALSLAYVKAYTARLSAVDLGFFFYITTLSLAINALILTPVDFYMQTRLADVGEVLPLPAIRRLVRNALLVAFGIAVVMVGILAPLGKIAPSDIVGLYLMAMFLYLCTAARGLLNNRGHKTFVSLMLVAEAAGRVATFLVMSVVMKPTARVLIYSSIVAFAIEFLIIIAYAARRIPFGTQGDPFDRGRTIVRMAYPISVSAVCNVLQLQTYRVLYVWFGVPATAAIYAVVSNLGAAGMSAISSVFSQMFLPRVYASRGTYLGTYVRNGLIAALLLAIGAALLAKPLLHFLTKDSYAAYAHVIYFGIIVEGGNLLIGAATIVLMFQSATQRLIIVNLTAAAASLLGQFAALKFAPSDPYAIGWPIAASQIIVVASLILHTCSKRASAKESIALQ